MAIIPFGRPDRGIVLFAGLSPASESSVKRVLRLMGVVCLVILIFQVCMWEESDTEKQNVPIPSTNQAAYAQAPLQNFPSQPPNVHASQPTLHPVTINGLTSFQNMPAQSAQPPGTTPTMQPNLGQIHQLQQEHHPTHPFVPPHQLQQPFQPQMQNMHSQSNHFQSEAKSSAEPARINAHQARVIMDAARRNHITLPPGFDPNSMSEDRLRSVMSIIQLEHNRNQQQQRQQQQQQQQQHQDQFQQDPSKQVPQAQQAMDQLFGQQMRTGQGQYTQ